MARVVITGMGAVSPMGVGTEVFWEGIVAGRNATRQFTGFDLTGFRSVRGGQVPDFDANAWFPTDRRALAATMGRGSQYAVAATRMALDAAGLDPSAVPAREVGVCLGTTMGEVQAILAAVEIWRATGIDTVPPDLVCQYPSGGMPVNVARVFGFRGPNMMVPTACAAGNYALGYAMWAIRRGRAKVMIAGGADPFSLGALAGFNRLLACAPEKVQPFDKNRKGMMVGEGCGILVVEDLAHAVARRAPIVAEVVGFGLSCDAHQMTQPDPEGEGAAATTRRALESAGIRPEQVDYFCAHGTGTPANDRVETVAVKKVFGEHAYRLPVSSIKSMIGHTMGAASALEAIATALAVKNDVIPPTIHYETPDPECDLDYVPNRAREHRVRLAVSNAYGFGGNNSTIVLAKWEGA